MKEIEIGKYYDEYTEEELKQIRPLEAKSTKNWLWDGKKWHYIPRD